MESLEIKGFALVLSCARALPGFKMSLKEIVPSPPLARPDNVTAALLLTVAMLAFTLETLAIRWLGTSAAVSQAALFRALGQMVVVLGWSLLRGGWPAMKSDHYGLHVARGMVSIVGWWLYYWTFQNMGIALATLLTFSSSLFVILLARPLLGERVHAASWFATLAGFGGIAIASGVGTMPFDLGVLVGLLSAALSAAIVFLTRTLAKTEDTLTIMTYIGIFVLTASVPAAWINWVPLGLFNATLLMGAGTLGALGMILMIEAYGRGEAAVLAPIPYIRVAFAIVLGYLVFGEVPGPHMLLGATIVVGCALFALRHEHRRKSRMP